MTMHSNPEAKEFRLRPSEKAARFTALSNLSPRSTLPILISLAALTAFMTGCGAPGEESGVARPGSGVERADPSLGAMSDDADAPRAVSGWKDAGIAQRFAATEISAQKTSETRTVDGEVYPVSKSPLKYVYDERSAPPSFREEWGAFTSGAEIKGFLHLGAVPSPRYSKRLVKSFETLRSWTEIRGVNDKPLFDEAFSTDEQGQPIPDAVDGTAPAAGETHFARLVLNTPVGKLPVRGAVTLYMRRGVLQADVTNIQPVKVPVFGTIIDMNKLNIHMKFYPFEKGWLVYGGAAVKLEKFKEALKPEDLVVSVDSLYNWLRDRTILPLE